MVRSCNLDLAVIKDLENGRHNTDILEIARVARVLGIATDVLVRDL